MQRSNSSFGLIRIISGITLVLFLSSNLAFADEFVVQPASLELAAKQPTAMFKLINPGSEPRIVKIQVMSFTQENGRDQMSPSTRLIVHPAQLTLKPGGEQTVKVGLRLSGPLWDEETYRLLLTEVPQGANVGDANAKPRSPQSLKLAMVPVSVLPPGRALSVR